MKTSKPPKSKAIKLRYATKTRHRRKFFHKIAVFVIIGALGSVMVALIHADSQTTALSSSCTLSALDVPSCGVLWGAYVPNYGLPTLENAVGRKFDIFQEYHDFSTTNSGAIPNTGDTSVMSGGRILLASWQDRIYSSGAVDSWANIAAGNYDSTVIIPQAQRIKALGSTKIFLSFAPEMDDTNSHPAATYGTPADFVAAYQHIHNVFAAQGVTNVIWVWTPTPGGRYATLASFYPGDNYVDWLGYDAYNFYSCNGDNTWNTPATVFGTFYNWVSAGNLGLGAETKPMIMDEYGSHEDPSNTTRNGAWYQSIPATLQSLPRLKAISQFDAAGTFCSTQLNGSDSLTGIIIPSGTLSGFTQAGLSSTVLGTTPPKTGDFNNDGQVNITDLSMLLSAWGTNNNSISTNLGTNGPITITDLSIFLSKWGT